MGVFCKFVISSCAAARAYRPWTAKYAIDIVGYSWIVLECSERPRRRISGHRDLCDLWVERYSHVDRNYMDNQTIFMNILIIFFTNLRSAAIFAFFNMYNFVHYCQLLGTTG
jgi:hypothetical protein